jgi:hypothetical protein
MMIATKEDHWEKVRNKGLGEWLKHIDHSGHQMHLHHPEIGKQMVISRS